MELEVRIWGLIGVAFDLVLGALFFYFGLNHAEEYGLKAIFNVTALVTIPVALGMGAFAVRALTSARRKGTLYYTSRWKRLCGPGYIDLALTLLIALSFAAQIAFFVERHGSLAAWEEWSLNPHQRTVLSVSNAILFAVCGVSCTGVGGIKLWWWLRFGKDANNS